MDVKAALVPGPNGTKRLNKKYEEQRVCVRYRYDKARRKQLKTIALIIDERDGSPGGTIQMDSRVAIPIGCGETELRKEVKNPEPGKGSLDALLS